MIAGTWLTWWAPERQDSKLQLLQLFSLIWKPLKTCQIFDFLVTLGDKALSFMPRSQVGLLWMKNLVNESSRRYWDESAFALPHNAHRLIDQGAPNGTNNFSMWCESMWIPDPGWCTESCHSSASIVGFLDLRCSKSLHGSEIRLTDSQSCFMIGTMFEHSWVAGFWE